MQKTFEDPIRANLAAAAVILARAAAQAAQAAGAETINGAIGSAVGLERELETAAALYRAALALHRS